MVKELNQAEKVSSGSHKKAPDFDTKKQSAKKTLDDVKKPLKTPLKKPATFKETDSIIEAEVIETRKSASRDKIIEHKDKIQVKDKTNTAKSSATNSKKSSNHPAVKVKTLGDIAAEREQAAKTSKNPAKSDVSKDSEVKASSRNNVEQNPQPKRQKVLRKKRTMPFFFRILFSALLLAGLSVIFTWYIFWQAKLGNVDKTWDFINEKPLIFSYSALIIFLAMSVIASITWRVFLTAGLSFSIIAALMYANAEKMASRATPLLPEDLHMADQVGAMTQFVDMGEIIRLAAGIILLIVGTILLDHFTKRWIGRDKKQIEWWERFALIPRITFTLMSIAALSLTIKPITHHSGDNFSTIDWLGVEFEAWNQATNYLKNGFVLGFVYNLGSTQVEEPADYNEAHVAEIMSKYDKIKDAEDKSRQSLTEAADNIIIVLNESFYDPNLLAYKYPYAGEDLLPNVHAIMRNYLGGYMYSPEYGGGTANVEFEVFTGLTNYWSRTMPYVDILSKTSEVPGIVNFAKQNGFQTTAIHAYEGSMYKRNLVYQNLGFDKFIDINEFKHRERETEISYLNDWSIYQEALDILNNNEGPQMIGLVTMQNHTWYNCGKPTDRDEIKMLEDTPYNLYLSYNCLQKSDYYLGEFIDELEESDERTVVLWYGDHAAGVLNEFIDSEDKIERDLAHLTPYFVYANFELEELYDKNEAKKINSENNFDFAEILLEGASNSSQRLAARKLGNGINLPTTSPNCLSNTLLDAINAKKPALYYLIGEVCKIEPIIAGPYLGAEGLKSNGAVEDYQVVNYDILNGKRYWLEK